MPIVETHKLAPSASHEQQDQVYNGLDACVTLEVFEELRHIWQEDAEGQGIINYDGIYAFERALQAPILEMMLRGFRIDEFERHRAVSELKQAMAQTDYALQRMAHAVQDQDLNPLSYKQLTEFFYKRMKLPEIWTSKKGVRKLSLDRESLEKLEAYFYARPIITAILAYRDLAKLCKMIETEIDSDGRWRTSYNIGGTETGRLSSSKSAWGTGSNTQNLRRDEESAGGGLPSIRRMFIADKGYKLCNIDLEQTESFDVGWLHGTLLNDWTYLDALERGDIHTQVAKMVWPELGWTSNSSHDRHIADRPFYRNMSYRDMAKRGGHLTNYMGTAYTASRALKVPIKIMEQFQRAYEAAFPAFPKWWRYVAQELQTTQRLVTPFGRERHFFGRPRDDATLREAIAFVPQSCTADRMNLGMWRIWKGLPEVELLAQVHDSVCFQIPEDWDVNAIVRTALALTRVEQRFAKRSMIVGAEAKVGWNWGAYDPLRNPDGMKKWKPNEPDQRQRTQHRVL